MSTEVILTEIESKIEKVHTQSLDLSFNELLSMYENEELDISPDYQRLFRWSEGARSRFIESLILEMPVPPIYVVETDSGAYQLIDGLQRFSSYLHLRGELDAKHMGVNKGDFLILSDCDIIDSINGMTFNDLPMALKIKLKRSFVRVEIVRKGSDKKFKYHMFKRLNTGGEALTEQQIRNCTIRMLDPKFNDFIIMLSETDDYLNCIANLSDSQRYGSYDQELVLRYFSLKNNKDGFKHDVADFMTEYMESVAGETVDFNYDENEQNFLKVFKLFNKAHGDKIFGRLNSQNNKLQSNFGIYHFESLCMGIQCVLDRIDINNEEHIKKFSQAVISLKGNADFKTETTGGGKNSTGLLNKRIKIAEGFFSEAFSD
ncbi:DUF262 domain-containing protein [Proteus terrae]|uniref:DUF262 domain-containing protein n=1 Tax=Proteus terrae TaxID=1574161 RepID=UPI000D69DA5E|nr:DUF262 domain-containing protein [Proteus terrae]DAP94918.1 MAG TPA: Protein of unknown function DUF262 [Caudoviricetes sp.]